MKDLRVEVRFKNAALLRAIEEKFSHLRAQSHNSGAGLLSKFAAHVGVSNQWLYQVASLSTSPFYEKRNAGFGKYKKTAINVADALDLPVEEIFPRELYSGKFKGARRVDMDAAMLLPLSSREAFLLPAPDGVEREEIAGNVNKALETLSEREQQVLDLHFGLSGPEQPLAAIGEKFGLTQERIRQIENRALRKLRHPARIAILKGNASLIP